MGKLLYTSGFIILFISSQLQAQQHIDNGVVIQPILALHKEFSNTSLENCNTINKFKFVRQVVLECTPQLNSSLSDKINDALIVIATLCETHTVLYSGNKSFGLFFLGVHALGTSYEDYYQNYVQIKQKFERMKKIWKRRNLNPLLYKDQLQQDFLWIQNNKKYIRGITHISFPLLDL